MIFENNIWSFFKLYKTALIYASENGRTETVKILIKQKEIDINAKDIYLFLSILISKI